MFEENNRVIGSHGSHLTIDGQRLVFKLTTRGQLLSILSEPNITENRHIGMEYLPWMGYPGHSLGMALANFNRNKDPEAELRLYLASLGCLGDEDLQREFLRRYEKTHPVCPRPRVWTPSKFSSPEERWLAGGCSWEDAVERQQVNYAQPAPPVQKPSSCVYYERRYTSQPIRPDQVIPPADPLAQ